MQREVLLMRKIIVLLMCCLVLGGCGEGKAQSQGSVQESTENNIDIAKEYTFEDLEKVSYWVMDEVVNSMSGLSDVEINGTSDEESERNKHRREIYDKYTDKVMERCEIKQGQKVIVSGYIGGNLHEVQSGSWTEDIGKISFSLKNSADEDDWQNGILCRTDDNSLLSLQENTPVKIEGIFMKHGTATGGGESLYDCKIIESGVPESVSETKEPLATPAFK